MKISPFAIDTLAKIEFGPENSLSKDYKEFVLSDHYNYPLSMRFTQQSIEKKNHSAPEYFLPRITEPENS